MRKIRGHLRGSWRTWKQTGLALRFLQGKPGQHLCVCLKHPKTGLQQTKSVRSQAQGCWQSCMNYIDEHVPSGTEMTVCR